jgi:hypothetical protein
MYHILVPYLGMVLSVQNSFHEEIKSGLNLVSVRYYSVQNLTSYHLLAKNLRMTIYETIMFPVVLYESHTLSRTVIKGALRTECWRNLHNEKLHYLCHSLNKITVITWRMRLILQAKHIAQNTKTHNNWSSSPTRSDLPWNSAGLWHLTPLIF